MGLYYLPSELPSHQVMGQRQARLLPFLDMQLLLPAPSTASGDSVRPYGCFCRYDLSVHFCTFGLAFRLCVAVLFFLTWTEPVLLPLILRGCDWF